MEDIEKIKQYSYVATSNLVLKAERPKDIGPSSDVFSLRSKYSIKDLSKTFGERARAVTPADLAKLKKEADAKKRKKTVDTMGTSKRARGPSSVLTMDIGAGYTPLSDETKNVFDVFLGTVQAVIPDQPHDVVRAVAEDVLAALKDENLTTHARQQQVQEALQSASTGKVGGEHFGRLYNLSQKLSDYSVASGEQPAKSEEQEWVPVTFEEEDEEEGMGEEEEEAGKGTGMGVSVVEEDEHDMLYSLADDHVQAEVAQMLAGATQPEEDAHVHPRVADAHWVQRQLSQYFPDADECARIAAQVLQLLCSDADSRRVEHELLELLDFERFDAIKTLLHNRFHIALGVRLHAVDSDEAQEAVIAEAAADARFAEAVQMLRSDRGETRTARPVGRALPAGSLEGPAAVKSAFWQQQQPKVVDISALAEGAARPLPKDCKLPANSQVITHKGYQEVHVPPPRAAPQTEADKRVAISDLPAWAQAGFTGMTALNRVQSRIFDTAFLSNNNMLVCAPTGAGKTNCAMLTIMRELGLHRVPRDSHKATNLLREGVAEDAPGLDLTAFKVVYVAPMKSLVQEMVLNFSSRLSKYGVSVRELSGDAQLTRQEMAETQVIVTTPEKWDIVTRKEGERSILSAVKLLIIDEIHLLHDSRGPVLETIVARTMRYTEQYQTHIRIVGLSATLPNYEDVALFLRVQLDDGLYFFDNSYRPCPLHQQFVGIAAKKAHKRTQMQNEVCYSKLSEHAGKNQVLVFTHSRKDTAATARFLRDQAVADKTISQYVLEGSGRHELLLAEAANAEHPGLREVLPYGFAFHHAGMSRKDRTLVEDLFAAQHVQVLVSTATLAWGVNLPAHAVIIKGTQVYNPEQGRWVELSAQDVQQMVGRAGRPQYDTYGEGILITSQDELQYYLSLLNTQLPVESQLLSRLVDALNAEVVSGVVNSVADGVEWLHYTYLYVRMLRNPALYGVTIADVEQDPELRVYCASLVHSALALLDKAGLVQYDRKSGAVASTELGRVASYYYLSYKSVGVYNEALKAQMTDVDILRVFAQSSEFSLLAVREEEKIELTRLLELVPIPVREPVDDPLCKVNVLLQAYLSNLTLTGFALAADMVYITQSAARIFRALFELLLRRGWAAPALSVLNYCKMIQARMWDTQSPLRQVTQCPIELTRRLEAKDLSWEHVCELDEVALGELLHAPRMGRKLHRWVHQVPRVECTGAVQPLSRSVLRVTLRLMCDFAWDDSLHGLSQPFWVWVEDVDGEVILHSEFVSLRKKHTVREHVLSFILPVFEPLPPHYFVRVVSDRWIGAQALFPVSLANLILPERFAPLTQVMDLQPLPVSDVANPVLLRYLTDAYPFLSHFNALQTQVFSALFSRDDNVCIAAPSGSGKTLMAELTLMRFWLQRKAALARAAKAREQSAENESDTESEPMRAVYVVPYMSQAEAVFERWSSGLCEALGLRAVLLTGDVGHDTQVGADADLVVGTAEHWDVVFRRWRAPRNAWLREVRLLVVDDAHMLESDGYGGCTSVDANLGLDGTVIEGVVTRAKQVALELEEPIRVVLLAAPVANGKNLADWLGTKLAFSFHPSVRPVPLATHIRPLHMEAHAARMQALPARIFADIAAHSAQGPVLVYACGVQETEALARELLRLGESAKHVLLGARAKELTAAGVPAEEVDKLSCVIGTPCTAEQAAVHPTFLRVSDDALVPHLEHVSEALAELLVMGVGLLHGALSVVERRVVMQLYRTGALQLLVVDNAACWWVGAQPALRANLVVVADTQYWDSVNAAYTDISVWNMTRMAGHALPPRSVLNAHMHAPGSAATLRGTAVVYTHSARASFYRKFLLDACPVESHLHLRVHGHLNSEVAGGRVTDMQQAVDFLTWTFFYRRLRQNPVYYNLLTLSNAAIAEHLSQLVSTAVDDLAHSGCLEQGDDGSLTPLNLGRIADYYSLQFPTMDLLATTLSERVTVRDLLWLLCNAAEMDQLIAVAPNEPSGLAALAQHLPLALPSAQRAANVAASASGPVAASGDDLLYGTAAAKAHVLLQAHLSRVPLVHAAKMDAEAAVGVATKVLAAITDVASSSRWLSAVVASIELAQMLGAAAWAHESPLLQVPHFTKAMAQQAAQLGVSSVPDISEMSGTDRKALLAPLDKKQKAEVAQFCNAFPQVEVQWAVRGALVSESKGAIAVMLDRTPEADEDEEEEWDDELVMRNGSRESWWLVVGDSENRVWGMKRVWIHQRMSKVKIDVVPVGAGTQQIKLYVLCDRYIGADQEINMDVEVVEAQDESDDE